MLQTGILVMSFITFLITVIQEEVMNAVVSFFACSVACTLTGRMCLAYSLCWTKFTHYSRIYFI